jgi:hypothetical protein
MAHAVSIYSLPDKYRARDLADVRRWGGHGDRNLLFQYVVYQRAVDLCATKHIRQVVDLPSNSHRRGPHAAGRRVTS